VGRVNKKDWILFGFGIPEKTDIPFTLTVVDFDFHRFYTFSEDVVPGPYSYPFEVFNA